MMVKKWVKRIVVVTLCVGVVGGLVFGKDLVSYMHSAGKSIQRTFASNVPIEFELQRARDMVEDIIPEMHANIQLIAEEEVEIDNLKNSIVASQEGLDSEKNRIARLKTMLTNNFASFRVDGYEYSRQQVRGDLAKSFDRFKEAEIILASKRRMLTSREQSLSAAIQLLEQTRSQKTLLEEKIQSLESQHRLLQASAVGSRLKLDDSKLAQTEKLIQQIKKRLDISERVLAHEGKFVHTIPVDTVDEQDLLAEIDEHFSLGEDTEDEVKLAAEFRSSGSE
jgi:hypothetical protein